MTNDLAYWALICIGCPLFGFIFGLPIAAAGAVVGRSIDRWIAKRKG